MMKRLSSYDSPQIFAILLFFVGSHCFYIFPYTVGVTVLNFRRRADAFCHNCSSCGATTPGSFRYRLFLAWVLAFCFILGKKIFVSIIVYVTTVWLLCHKGFTFLLTHFTEWMTLRALSTVRTYDNGCRRTHARTHGDNMFTIIVTINCFTIRRSVVQINFSTVLKCRK